MKVYKVVRKVNGKLKSAIERRRKGRAIAQLTYAVGKTTRPRFGKIFAFGSSEPAVRFLGRCWNGKLFEAEAPDAEPIRLVASDALRGGKCYARFKEFWEKGAVDTMDAPTGTVVCSELTLIRRINK